MWLSGTGEAPLLHKGPESPWAGAAASWPSSFAWDSLHRGPMVGTGSEILALLISLPGSSVARPFCLGRALCMHSWGLLMSNESPALIMGTPAGPAQPINAIETCLPCALHIYARCTDTGRVLQLLLVLHPHSLHWVLLNHAYSGCLQTLMLAGCAGMLAAKYRANGFTPPCV